MVMEAFTKASPTINEEKPIEKKHPVIIIVKDKKGQAINNKVDVLINGKLEGKAGKTFYLQEGKGNLQLQWKEKIYQDIIDIKAGPPILKVLVSIEDFR